MKAMVRSAGFAEKDGNAYTDGELLARFLPALVRHMRRFLICPV
jgi:hypothetical protein